MLIFIIMVMFDPIFYNPVSVGPDFVDLVLTGTVTEILMGIAHGFNTLNVKLKLVLSRVV